MMKNVLIAASICLLFAACNGNKKNTTDRPVTTETVAQSADDSLNCVGTYIGTFPAADGPGVQTILRLQSDKSFELISTYLETDNATFKEYGTYTIENQILTLINGDDKHYYSISENTLTALNQEKQPAGGETADLYVLHKQN